MRTSISKCVACALGCTIGLTGSGLNAQTICPGALYPQAQYIVPPLGGITAADIDLDGDTDILFTYQLTPQFLGQVGYLLNDGTGTFTTSLFGGPALPWVPVGILAGNIDGDLQSTPDLVVFASQMATAWIFIGTPGSPGSFGSPSSTLTVATPVGEAYLAPINNDALPDLIFSGASVLRLHLNNGTGSFGGPIPLPPPAGAQQFDLADLDCDGALDVAYIGGFQNEPLYYYVNLNNLAGGLSGPFGPVITGSAASAGYDLAIADVDVDGINDLLEAFVWTYDIQVAMNAGCAPTFAPPAQLLNGGVVVMVADLDANGTSDFGFEQLVFPPIQPDYPRPVDIYLNGSTPGSPALSLAATRWDLGSAIAPGTLPSLAPFAPLPAVAPLNLDGDGVADTMMVLPTGRIAISLSQRRPLVNTQILLPVAATITDLALADLDNSGTLDIATTYLDSTGFGGMATITNGGLGAYSSTSYYPIQGGSQGSPLAITAVDFNTDGWMDLVVGPDQAAVRPFKNMGGGVFQPLPPTGPQWSIGLIEGNQSVNGGSLLLDNDMFPDLVVGPANSQSEIAVLFGDGAGGFSETLPVLTDAAGSGVTGIAVADLNNDSWPDIAVTVGAGTNGTIDVILSNGNGGFLTPIYIAVGTAIKSIVLGDINADGTTDAVVLDQPLGVAGLVWFLLNPGNGALLPVASIAGGTGSSLLSAIALGDADGDGDLDVAVTEDNPASPSSVWLYLNDGLGAFAPGGVFAAGAHSVAIAMGALSMRAASDIVVGHSGADSTLGQPIDTISILGNTCQVLGDLNLSGGVDGADLGILLSAWGTAGGDLNGDGVTDGADLGVLLANWTG